MPLASTYSIVARDPDTGYMGVAVQSHWFSVGSLVPWAEAGVGVVATQCFVEQSYGPLGLNLLKVGKTAEEALEALIKEDPKSAHRQVAILDSKGRVAAHTGRLCIPEAGHIIGDGYSVQANLMSSADVWPAMADAFESSEGDLAYRLLAALEAGEAAGGDIRGMQSAAILVVSRKLSSRPWAEVIVDLRVEDSPHPLEEMRRLLRLHDAYSHSNRGDEYMASGKVEEALKEYEIASKLAPEVLELSFWQAIALLNSNRMEEAINILKRVFRSESRWIEILRRLPKAGMVRSDLVEEVMTEVGVT